MVPRKNRPVLFEVVSRSQRARGRTGLQRPVAPPAPSAPPPATPTTPLLPTFTAADTPRQPLAFQIADGRVHLVLGWPHLAVIGIAALVVLFIVFQAGRTSAQPAPARSSSIDNVLAGAPETQTPPPAEPATPRSVPRRSAGPAVTPLGQGQPAAEPEPTKTPPVPKPVARQPSPEPPAKEKDKEKESVESPAFAAGSYYVVIQHFRTRDRDKADAAREFLRGKGVSCVVRSGGGDLELVATDAFASEAQAQEFIRRVLALGKEYWNSGGGYEFTGAKARKF